MEITTPVDVPKKVCEDHDIVWVLIGEKCPRCNRRALTAYE